MPFSATTATQKVRGMNKRLRLLSGGTSASKTISIELNLIDFAQTDVKPTLTSIVSESLPHLKRGAMRDFLNIMDTQGYYDDARWNKSDFTYTFPLIEYARYENGMLKPHPDTGMPIPIRQVGPTGSKIEFFSADMPSKVRGPRRDRLFANEVNNLPREAWEQLLLRTREFAYADWNPVGNFYMYDDYGLNDEDGASTTDDRVDFLILTYKDNEALETAIIEDIKRKAELNPAWGRVYAEGKRGEMEGKIFNGWKIYDEVPHEARLEARGLDFGYAQDPAALCDIYKYNGAYIIDELVYRKGMLNRQLADIILNQQDPNVLTIADSAEPKSIAEMQEYGVNIIGVEKKGVAGVNFTNSAIQFVQGQRMGITKRSLNYLKSYRSFMWQTDKEGTVIPKYDHFESDGMMSVVYGMTSFQPREEDEAVYTTGNFSSQWV